MAPAAGGAHETTARLFVGEGVRVRRAGARHQAREIVQAERPDLAAWLHGIVHTLEGDLGTARDWYRRAGRDFPGRKAVQQEIAAARRKVTR